MSVKQVKCVAVGRCQRPQCTKNLQEPASAAIIKDSPPKTVRGTCVDCGNEKWMVKPQMKDTVRVISRSMKHNLANLLIYATLFQHVNLVPRFYTLL